MSGAGGEGRRAAGLDTADLPQLYTQLHNGAPGGLLHQHRHNGESVRRCVRVQRPAVRPGARGVSPRCAKCSNSLNHQN